MKKWFEIGELLQVFKNAFAAPAPKKPRIPLNRRTIALRRSMAVDDRGNDNSAADGALLQASSSLDSSSLD